MILRSDSIAGVRDAIRSWVHLLATKRFGEAAQEINTHDSPCSSELLVEAIGRYSRKYRDAALSEKADLFPKITSPKEMVSAGENLVIYVKRDGTVIEYDLPINNAWSDLTVKFQLKRLIGGEYDLSLLDIRVL